MTPGTSVPLFEREGIWWVAFYGGAIADGRHSVTVSVGSDAADWVSPLTVYLPHAPTSETELRLRVAFALMEVVAGIMAPRAGTSDVVGRR